MQKPTSHRIFQVFPPACVLVGSSELTGLTGKANSLEPHLMRQAIASSLPRPGEGTEYFTQGDSQMYLVMTTVKVKSGKVDEVRDLFERTNPDLVKDQTDWVEAKFTANREEDQVTVLAFW